MRVANCVVGQLKVFVSVHLTAGPEAAIAVLVGGEILEDRLHLRAVRVSGIGQGNVPTGGEMTIGPGAAVGHEPSKFEWEVLPLNSFTFIRRGQVFIPIS